LPIFAVLKVLIINGPNLNLLGSREPEIYGSSTFEDVMDDLKTRFPQVDFSYYQSNAEGELIDKLHEVNKHDFKGIVLNAGGYSHTSVALADAVAAINIPVITVHISNIYNREKERHQELLSGYAKGGIFGLGLKGYGFAVASLIADSSD
jgi:3-dehydroquinate dehydratase-2